MDTDEVIRVVVAWLKGRYPKDDPDLAIFKLASGRTVPLDLAGALPDPRKEEKKKGKKQLWWDIVDTLHAAGEPLKMETLRKRLADAGETVSPSTLKKELPEMQREGWIENTEDGYRPIE